MLVALLLRWLVFAAAFAVTAWILHGMDVSGGFGSYLWRRRQPAQPSPGQTTSM